jgi:hypothetical protein
MESFGTLIDAGIYETPNNILIRKQLLAGYTGLAIPNWVPGAFNPRSYQQMLDHLKKWHVEGKRHLILEELADGIEDVSITTSLVVRYVQAYRLWTDHPNPAINSLETLLCTVDGIQYVQAGTVVGTSSQLMRARAIRLIEKHWGADWFLKIPADMKDPAWSTAADCSHQLLRLVAADAKQRFDLETAKSAWAQSIRRRRDERVRKELRMRCPRSPFIITNDVRSLNQTLGLS